MFNFGKRNENEEVMKTKGLFLGRKITIDDDFVTITGKTYVRVEKKKIDTVSIAFNVMGVKLQLLGSGTVLGETVIKKRKSEKVQKWIMDRI